MLSNPDQLKQGDVLDGKFQVERVLGAGGMGMVIAAQHLHLQRPVAIKLMLPGFTQSEEAVARFMREGRAAARLRSEHVGKVLDVGKLATGEPYMVMEFLDGSDLSELVQQRGAISVEEAVDYVLQASEAIAEAHAAGIVHRDLKPANLFLSVDAYGEACVKVLDFGISKVAGQGPNTAGLTGTSTMMGSPMYMSPEQMRSARDVDHRCDIWALGTILFELLTGRVAWPGENMAEVCVSVATDPAPSMRALRSDLPPELDAVVMRCMEKDSGRRYATVVELAQALAPFAPASSQLTISRLMRLSGGVGAPVAADATGRSLAVQTGAAQTGPDRTGPYQTADPRLGTGVTAAQSAGGPSPDTRAAWGQDKTKESPAGVPQRVPVVPLIIAGASLLAVIGVAIAGITVLTSSGDQPQPAAEVSARPAESSTPEPGILPVDPNAIPLPASSTSAASEGDAAEEDSKPEVSPSGTSRTSTPRRRPATKPAPTKPAPATPVAKPAPPPRAPAPTTRPRPTRPSMPDFGGRE